MKTQFLFPLMALLIMGQLACDSKSTEDQTDEEAKPSEDEMVVASTEPVEMGEGEFFLRTSFNGRDIILNSDGRESMEMLNDEMTFFFPRTDEPGIELEIDDLDDMLEDTEDVSTLVGEDIEVEIETTDGWIDQSFSIETQGQINAITEMDDHYVLEGMIKPKGTDDEKLGEGTFRIRVAKD